MGFELVGYEWAGYVVYGRVRMRDSRSRVSGFGGVASPGCWPVGFRGRDSLAEFDQWILPVGVVWWHSPVSVDQWGLPVGVGRWDSPVGVDRWDTAVGVGR
jgi:hypothetical protein